MKKAMLFVALLATLAACNTIDGVGQDISASARAIDRAI